MKGAKRMALIVASALAGLHGREFENRQKLLTNICEEPSLRGPWQAEEQLLLVWGRSNLIWRGAMAKEVGWKWISGQFTGQDQRFKPIFLAHDSRVLRLLRPGWK